MTKPFFTDFNLTAERASELISSIFEYLAELYKNEDILDEGEYIKELLKMANSVNKKEELLYIGYECGRVIASLAVSGYPLRYEYLMNLLEEIAETGDAKTAVYNRMKDAENKAKVARRVNENED